MNNTSDPFVEWAYGRIQRNKNCIIIINGPTGSGKTYWALRKAVDLSKRLGVTFTAKDNIAFTFLDLMKKSMLPINEKPGSILFFEEAGSIGSGASFREWQSRSNALVNSILQTNRCKNQIFILTCPLFTNFDASSRKLVHMQVEMIGINTQLQESYAKPYLLQVNTKSGKLYFKLLRFHKAGKRHKLVSLKAELPPEDLIKEYEAMKMQYVNALNKRIIGELDKAKAKEDQIDLKKPQAKGKVDVDVLKGLIEQGYSSRQCALKIGCSKALIDWYRKTKLRGVVYNKNVVVKA